MCDLLQQQIKNTIKGQSIKPIQEKTGVKDLAVLHFIKCMDDQRAKIEEELPYPRLPGSEATVELCVREWARINQRWNPLLDI